MILNELKGDPVDKVCERELALSQLRAIGTGNSSTELLICRQRSNSARSLRRLTAPSRQTSETGGACAIGTMTRPEVPCGLRPATAFHPEAAAPRYQATANECWIARYFRTYQCHLHHMNMGVSAAVKSLLADPVAGVPRCIQSPSSCENRLNSRLPL